jgi:hypothetical protein
LELVKTFLYIFFISSESVVSLFTVAVLSTAGVEVASFETVPDAFWGVPVAEAVVAEAVVAEAVVAEAVVAEAVVSEAVVAEAVVDAGDDVLFELVSVFGALVGAGGDVVFELVSAIVYYTKLFFLR